MDENTRTKERAGADRKKRGIGVMVEGEETPTKHQKYSPRTKEPFRYI